MIKTKPGFVKIEGKIVEVRSGSKSIRRSYTYGYMSLRVMVGFEYYSVLVSTSKINNYGFLPRVGQWIRAEGLLSKNNDNIYDQSLSHLRLLEHIEPPKSKC